MFDEPRTHDPNPNREEREWMATNPFSVALRVAAVAGIAVLMGMAASHSVDSDPPSASAIAAAP